MAEKRTCPKCGKDLAANAPEGLCPQCLMAAGLPTDVDADKAADSQGQGVIATSATPPSGFVPPDPAELGKKFPQLEIIELLGQGGMGAVYKARQKQLDRLVALKILPPTIGADPAFAERFTREAQSMAKLNHPRVVSIYDFGRTDDGLFYFIMEYVDGTDLRHIIQTGQITSDEALAIVPQVCEALQFAHKKGIVHRDIKPENILLDKEGCVKIADFGLARLVNLPATAYTLTQPRQRMGTPHYMAPEQIAGAHGVDHRADIYSLGVVFYEMLTGELPIGRFAPPSQKVQVDVRLDDIVLKSLEQEPERRYQHASEVKTDVEAISSAEPILAGPLPGEGKTKLEVEQMKQNGKNNIGKLSLFLAIGGVVLAIALWLLLAIFDWLTKFGPPYFLCILLFVALEIAALVTGIIGRRSACGKAGLTISAILLILTAIGYPFFMVVGMRTIDQSMTETKMVALDEPAAFSKEREERVKLRIKLEKGFQTLVRVKQDTRRQVQMEDEQSEGTANVTADLLLKCLDVAPDGVMTIMQQPQELQITAIGPEGRSMAYFLKTDEQVPHELMPLFIDLGRTYFFKIKPNGAILSGRFEESMNIYPPDAPKDQIAKGLDWTDADTPEAGKFLDGLAARWKGLILPLPQEDLVSGKTIRQELAYSGLPDKIEHAWTLTNRNGNLIDVEIVSSAEMQETTPDADSSVKIHTRAGATTKAKIDLRTGLVQSADRQWQSDPSFIMPAAVVGGPEKVSTMHASGKETWRIVEGEPGAGLNDALLRAAENGWGVEVKKFLGERIDADYRDTGGQTALMKAAAGGHADCVKLLMVWADESIRDKQGRTALMHAVINKQSMFLREMGEADYRKGWKKHGLSHPFRLRREGMPPFRGLNTFFKLKERK